MREKKTALTFVRQIDIQGGWKSGEVESGGEREREEQKLGKA